jgi:cytochrome c biogenesis protein CcmG/thiol:disulfide interchange protein DsbE
VKRGKVFFRCLLAIFILLGLHDLTVAGDDLFQKIGVKQIKGNRKVPNFCLQDLSGRKVELQDFKGKVIFLNFWATWCGPCKEEMPSMEWLWQQFKEKDFVFLSVSVDYEGIKHVKEFIERHRYTFHVLVDPKCQALDLYEVKGIPTTFIIDKRGRMRGKTVSARDWKNPHVTTLLKQLIEESS